MLLKKLRTNHSFNLIIFPVLAIMFWLKSFIYQSRYPFFQTETNNLLYLPLHNSLRHSVFLQNLTAFLIFLLIAILILQLNNRFSFLQVRTMLPATIFVLLAGGFTSIQTLHPAYLAAVFLLLSLYRLLSAYERPKPHQAAFDAGFFFGLSLLIYTGLIVLLPAVIIGIGVLSRESKWREITILIIGLILPIIFALSYVFIIDDVPNFTENIISNLYTDVTPLSENLPLMLYIGFLLFLTLIGSIKIIKDYDTKKISVRKYFIVFFVYFICSVCGIVFVPSVSQEMFIITSVPLTFLISNYFIFSKNRFWSEFLFTLLILVIVIFNIFF